MAINWELCKRLEFDPSDKQFLHKPGSVLENNKRKILLDFEIQTDHKISLKEFKEWNIFSSGGFYCSGR